MSEEAYEWARDKAEAEYFAHVESTDGYPQLPTSNILVGNELTSNGEQPF